MQMVIGTRKWSTWSMRPWLVARRAGLMFEDVVVPLRTLQTSKALEPYSPAGQAPVLIDGELTVWDSLAICEHLAERHPDKALWPRDPAARAVARSACAQMHGGFQSLRGECPMDLSFREAVTVSEATHNDLRRLVELWSGHLKRFGGPFLVGEWSIADAFYTPVATRLRSYGLILSDYGDAGACGAYAERLLETPEFLDWEKAALADVRTEGQS